MNYMCAFNEEKDIIWYWDEPTITLDYQEHEFHEILERNWKQNRIPNVVLSSATLPDKAIQNKTVTYFGLDFNVPGTVKYPGSESWAVNFRCDEGINIRTKMENFTKEIFDDETSTGLYGVPIEEATMDLLGKDLEPVRRYTFVGLYPVSVGTLSYDVKDDGEPLTMDLTFAYQFYRTDR